MTRISDHTHTARIYLQRLQAEVDATFEIEAAYCPERGWDVRRCRLSEWANVGRVGDAETLGRSTLVEIEGSAAVGVMESTAEADWREIAVPDDGSDDRYEARRDMEEAA